MSKPMIEYDWYSPEMKIEDAVEHLVNDVVREVLAERGDEEEMIEPCPHCGRRIFHMGQYDENHGCPYPIAKYWRLRCNCGASMSGFATREGVIRAWNGRTK